MILKRYGSRIHAVRPRFDARALTEVSFERGDEAWDAESWLEAHERVGEHTLSAATEGDVKDESEQALLAELRQSLESIEEELGEAGILLVENGSGADHPKTRDTTAQVHHPLGTRLHFQWRIEPPLRVGVYRPRTPA